ncbi:MAG: hypothetical protein HY886_07135 [Deltaproteobacteria bacterium]|nr:hypothetical protein [Deltaproteobacteria bacterium]
MPSDLGTTGFHGKTEGYEGRAPSRSRVLLREPERCAVCNKVFLSLYPLRSCYEHEGLDEM